MEVELKLLLAPSDVPAFRGLDLLQRSAAGKPRTRRLASTYFDTPALDLHRHGLELRVRRDGRHWVQTLKTSDPAAAGLHQRGEWEAPVPGPEPDLKTLCAAVADDDAAKLLSQPTLTQSLTPIFETAYRRTAWPLHLPPGTDVELVLDEGELRCGDSREPICEVECELKAGVPAALFDLARQMQDGVPLRIGNVGKAARGYALLSPQAPSAVKAQPVELHAAMTVEQGFQAIASSCLAQVQANEPGVIAGSDAESVHQMRVGMRRLRSLLRLFARQMPLPPALQAELDWLTGELGAARDADVLADSILPKIVQACAQEAAVGGLQRAAASQAAAKRRLAAAAVGSARYARLTLDLAAWVHAARWRDALDEPTRTQLEEPLAERAAKILERRHKRLRQRGERLLDGTPEERHRARIAAKKARYATEFFQSLLPAKRVK
ncbi:MAG TPA: CYTH and CHAD domain-containing protein, partial [Burkholderiaceae bacterium]|nr:CYTH and CHAD domain-containing protein [Burkholderiaceae bacterium]